ncbi:MAG: DedA family protein [Bacteroidales bacterium]|nr:DedA family protein [Bacteroidales bacterium]
MQTMAFIQWCIAHLNYWTITLLMAIESSFIPLPSEIVVPPAGYMAASTGEMNIFLVILFSTLGCVIGALVNYGLAYWLGRPIVYKFANSRLGHLFMLNEQKIYKSESFFQHHGSISTFIGRLMPAVRHLISIPAGLARMKLSNFVLFTALGSLIWNSILAVAGYYFASVIPLDQLHEHIKVYSTKVGYGFLVIGVLLVAYWVYKGMRKK